jgi:hypothetical protein
MSNQICVGQFRLLHRETEETGKKKEAIAALDSRVYKFLCRHYLHPHPLLVGLLVGLYRVVSRYRLRRR